MIPSKTSKPTGFWNSFAAHTQLLVKIAWRNLWLHRGKSFIIGSILFTGTLVMTVGNGVLTGMDRGISRNLIHGMMGHLTLMYEGQEDEGIFFANMGESAELLPEWEKTRDILKSHPEIDKYIPLNKGMFLVVFESETTAGEPTWILPFGVDFPRYLQTYSNVELMAGRIPNPGERGIVIHHETRERFYKTFGILLGPQGEPWGASNDIPVQAWSNHATITVQTDMVLVGISDKKSTLDIRVPILGIYRNPKIDFYEADLLDMVSYREGMNYTTGEETLKASAAMTSMLTLDDDALLAGFNEQGGVAGSVGNIQNMLARPRDVQKVVDLDKGGYEMAMIHLKTEDEKKMLQIRDSLNKQFKDAGIKVKAVHWRKAAGQIANMAGVIRAALFIFVAFVFFVAGIVIMNTLAMATMERSAELGMMRAVGAQKRFLGEMLLTEISVLAAVFGAIGMVVGAVVVKLLAAAGFSTTNDMAQLFFGGNIFRPQLTPLDILLGIFLLAVATILSSLYPARLAQKITALDAVTRD